MQENEIDPRFVQIQYYLVILDIGKVQYLVLIRVVLTRPCCVYVFIKSIHFKISVVHNLQLTQFDGHSADVSLKTG